MRKLKIYDFRVYLDINSGECEADVMNTDVSRNKKIDEKTKELFNLIREKSDKELKGEYNFIENFKEV